MAHSLDITLAGGRYDRVQPLIEGSVSPAGVDLRYLPMSIEEVFWRALRHKEFDAAELSLAYYIILRAAGDEQWTAIPIFPSRFFRHGCIFVPQSSERRSLDSLRGAIVGLPEYAMTACVWLRGLLSDEYGIEPSEIAWRYGGIEAPGREDRVQLQPPPGVDLRPIESDETLNGVLAEGGIDALMAPRIPASYWHGAVRRLLPDYQAEEQRYFERTGIFPPMHVLAIRTDVYERYPWLARSLLDAYEQAKALAYSWLADINALPISLPWYVGEFERTRRLFREDPWPSGVEANRTAVETLGRYLTEQGLAGKVDVDDLFAEETRDRFVI